MITIACVKWGDAYSSDYVNKLYNSIKRNLTLPFKFICFTENASRLNPNISIINLINSLPSNTKKFRGWWYKLEMFRSDNGLTGRIFFVDLDTVIVGNIDRIANTTKGFIGLKDFHLKDVIGSGLLAWTAGEHAYLWDNFIENPDKVIKNVRGDQNWIQAQHEKRNIKIELWQSLFPNQIVSYKIHCKRTRRLPHDARIVIFYGQPRPHMIIPQPNWMKAHWK